MDALSQKDIDSLLKGAAPVVKTAKAPEVLPYNFLRPPRISKDRRATLEAVHSRFVLTVQSYLSSRLRTPTDVTLTSVEQATFGEFLFSLATPCTAYVFELGDSSGSQGVIDLGSALSFQIIDRMFGGYGDGEELTRALTKLEQTVVAGVVERVLAQYRDAWGELLPMAPEVSSFESVPETLQIASREDNVVVANLDVKVGPAAGFLTICLPLSALEAFLQDKSKAVVSSGRASTEKRDAEIPLIEATVRKAHIPITVCFPSLRLRGRDATRLAVGQVLHTGRPLDTPVEIHLNGKPQFLGTLGRRDGFVGVSLTRQLPLGHTPSPNSPTGRIIE